MSILRSGDHVVFVCVGNRSRSPIAAAMFAAEMKTRGLDCQIESAGTMSQVEGMRAAGAWANFEPTRGYDLSQHRSRHIGRVKLTSKSFIVFLDDDAKRTMEQMEGWEYLDQSRIFLLYSVSGVFDPSGSRFLRAYEECFRQIKKGLDELIGEIVPT